MTSGGGVSVPSGRMLGMGPVTGEDGIDRCPWAGGPGVMRDYHDREWGNRVHGEAAYLERLTLEAFQSGLSWSTITRPPAQRYSGFSKSKRVPSFQADRWLP